MAELLERDELLDRLATLPPGRFVFVGGEAGVGKTSLVRALSERVGGRTLLGSSENLTTPTPLGPFLDIGVTPGDARTVAAAVIDELRSPTLLVLEDLHWADQASLDVLRVLCRRVDRTPSRVLATYRDDEVEGSHPLRVVLGEVASAPAVSRVSVPRLSRGAVRELASDRAADADAVFELTRGNAFYVTEVLATGGALPETVRDAVLARAASLGTDARRLLDVAALVPARAELWLLEAVAPSELAHLDECLESGMLRAAGDAVEFRHELARLAIEEATPPQRRRAAHRAILDALTSAPTGAQDPARLAHHAEGAGDADAVLEHGLEAARRAEAAFAHREAHAQYVRVLRHATGLVPAERARLLDSYSQQASFTGHYVDALAAVDEAAALFRAVGDRLAEGEVTARRQGPLIWLGRNDEAEDASRAAIESLEEFPESPELAFAYVAQGSLRMLNRDNYEGVEWAEKALAIAERIGADEVRARALNIIGASYVMAGEIERGIEFLERSLDVARSGGLSQHLASGYSMLASALGEMYELERSEHFAHAFVAHAEEHGIDNAYIRSWLACVRAYRGDWDGATALALEVIRGGVAGIPGITASIALGRVRARRGDPGAMEALDEALALAVPGGHLQRLGHAYAARAEAMFLAGDHDRAAEEARAVYALALEKRHLWFAGELAYWQWKADALDAAPEWVAEPYALQLRGAAHEAAAAWRAHDCPYEAARALAEADDDGALEALAEFERLGAGPAAKHVRERLRAHGVPVPRGPRGATRANVAALTSRELEVLRLVAAGLRNAEVAAELVVSRRTVDHHVAAILRKLGVKTRGAATAAASQLGLLEDQ